MFTSVRLFGERHSVGGMGRVCFSRFEDAAEGLIKDFGGSVRTVYMDPPFGTGSVFEYRDGRHTVAYSDRLSDAEMAEMMRSAVTLAKALLAPDGTLFVHVDHRLSARLRMLCDEILGEKCFTNEIIWTYKSGGRSKKAFSKKHDTLLMYRMSPRAYFNIAAIGVPRGPHRRNHMKRGIADDGRVYYSIRSNGREYRYYEDDLVFPSDVWDDIEHLHQRDPERTGFVTQKPEALLRRVILACSTEGDTVADLFGGSGTTAAVAVKEGRRFITVDRGEISLMVTRRRLLEQSARLGMFGTAKPFEVSYFEPQGCDMELHDIFDITHEDGGVCLAVKRGGAERLSYAAAGTMTDGNAPVFVAESYMLRPKENARIYLRRGCVLHVAGSDAQNGFFQLD